MFELKEADFAARLSAVHRALYLLLNEGYHRASAECAVRAELCGEALRLAGLLLEDREDLIHKAVGWMLREVGKRDVPALEGFLGANYRRMPRTMLRYAIERIPEVRRRQYLKGEV